MGEWGGRGAAATGGQSPELLERLLVLSDVVDAAPAPFEPDESFELDESFEPESFDPESFEPEAFESEDESPDPLSDRDFEPTPAVDRLSVL